RLRVVHLGRERIPASTLLAELVDDVVEADEKVLVEERVGTRGAIHVVTRLRLGLGRDLRGHLQMRHRVDANGAVGLLREHFRLPTQLVIGRGPEMVPRQERQLALLGERRGRPRAEPCGAEGAGRRGPEELAASQPSDHRYAPFGSGPWSEREEWGSSTAPGSPCQATSAVGSDVSRRET